MKRKKLVTREPALWRAAARLARAEAARQRVPFTSLFSDSLSGDVARFRVLRSLRKEGGTMLSRDVALEEMLGV